MIGFVFSVIGITVGWFLNQIGQWFSTRAGRKKTLKLVLFHLLETYFLFSRSDLDLYSEKILKRVKEKIPEDEQTEETDLLIKRFFRELLERYIKPDILKKLTDIEPVYKNAIASLAEIYPITAYYLYGKVSILEQLEWIKSYTQELLDSYPAWKNELQMGYHEDVEAKLMPHLFKEIQTEFETDIRKISWRISPLTWIRTKKTIRIISKDINERMERRIDRLFDLLDE